MISSRAGGSLAPAATAPGRPGCSRGAGETRRRVDGLPGLVAIVWALFVLAACDRPSASGTEAGPWFVESAAASGIVFTHVSGHASRHLFPEIIGGGAALFDMDGDGDLDAYLVQSGSLDGPGSANAGHGAPGGGPSDPTGPIPAARNALFENVGGGRFRDVSAGSGADDPGYGMGVAAGDYDNDGDTDLYVTNYGTNALLRNEGGGRFLDVTAAAGVGDPGWSTSAAFLDYDNDGDLDLFVVNYVNWTPGAEQDCYNPTGALDYCLPTNYNAPAADRLYRNEGGGVFVDVSRDAGLGAAFGNGLGVASGDFDGNGFVDIFVANDTMMNQLWLNEDGRRFREEGLVRGCALDEHGMSKAGMGVAVADVDDDGDLDLLVVNLENQTDSFYENDGGYFSDATGGMGLGSTSRGFTRFGVGLVDFDNDGRLDLYEANGRVMRSSESAGADPFAESNLVFRGLAGGGLEEVVPRGGTGAPLVATSRAAAFGDVDGDGGIDVLISNRDASAHLLMNRVPGRGARVEFRVLDEHGRDALGAELYATVGDRRLRRDVRAAYSYCASSDARVHIGMGGAARATDVTVRWPGGAEEAFGSFEAGAAVTLRRGEGTTPGAGSP